MTFDPKCYDLACAFLDDCKGVTEEMRNELAARIQQTIEDYGQELMEEEEAAKDAAAERDGDEARDWGLYRGELQHQQDMARRLK